MRASIVTGANRGIGLELCRQLSERGDRVVGVCREPSAALQGLRVEIVAGVDVALEADRRRLAEVLPVDRIDWLVHNAGVMSIDAVFDLNPASVERQLAVNAVGPVHLTALLLPKLVAGSKVAIVTSRMGSIGDNSSGGMYGYRMSKAAVNAAGRSLAHDLAPRGISVLLLHPGFVATDMTFSQGTVRPADSVRGMIGRIDELDAARSGTFVDYLGADLPW